MANGDLMRPSGLVTAFEYNGKTMNSVRKTINLVFLSATALAFMLPFNTVMAGSTDIIEKGRKVYNEVAGIGCKICHGDYAEGDLGVGPFIRGAGEGAIRAAVSAVGEMVVIRGAIKDDELAAVAAYLEHLGTLQVARTLSKRGRFVPKSLAVQPGTDLQIVIKNSSIQPNTYTSSNMDIEPLTVQGRSTSSLVWQAPDTEGIYKIACVDCRLDEEFTIEVTKAAKSFPGTRTTRTGTGNTDM